MGDGGTDGFFILVLINTAFPRESLLKILETWGNLM